jgi:Type II secretory pathway, pseudopilin PulG
MIILRTQRGFSLIQALIAAAILAIFVAAFSDLLMNMQKEVKRNKNKQDRILINYQIDQAVTSPTGIKESALLPANSNLKACVLGGTSGGCQTGTVNQFYLLDPQDKNPDVSARTRLSGPVSDPVFYDDSSNSGCTANCAYTVSSTFKAHCPGGVTSCDHAEHLQFEMVYKPVQGKEHLMKETTKSLLYFVNLNYRPFITTIANQNIPVNGFQNISVYGNSGHPSEVQNFIFETCKSADEGVAKVTCYGFSSGMSTIKVNGISVGTTTITLQINDAGNENNISPEVSFNVTVIP